MNCPRCKRPMEEQRGTFHKQRKWRCPRCGRVRLQRPRRLRRDGHRGAEA